MELDQHTYLIFHAIIADRLGKLRDKNCSPENFRHHVRDIANILGVTATKNLSLGNIDIETPMEKTGAQKLSGTPPLIVPILRAGLGLSDTLQTILPEADTGHIGLYRNEETLQPVEYLNKLPADMHRPIFICDPMLATAGSMIATINALVHHGASPENMTIITLLCAPEGIANLRKEFRTIPLYTAAIDSHLNEQGYIVPGLGDAGDRYFGTN